MGTNFEAAYPGHRRFPTPGEASAAERGWHDAERGWGAIEESAAYRKGYFDFIDWDDNRADARREQLEQAAHDEMEE